MKAKPLFAMPIHSLVLVGIVTALVSACGGGGSGEPGSPGNGGTAMMPNPPMVTDTDADGINDDADNCPAVANADQADLDGNGVGNLCDDDCGTVLTAVEPFGCRVAGPGPGTQFSLSGAPEGMVIQQRSGQLQWTPATHQQGDFSVNVLRTRASQTTSETVVFTVAPGTQAMPLGLYVSPDGDDAAAGTPSAPVATLQEAGKRVAPGDTIYLRGGAYFNEGFGTAFAGRRNNFARLTVQATQAAPITVKNWGNEYPQLHSDVNGLSVANARYWTFEGLELIGTNQSLDVETSLQHWWDTSDNANKIQGRGIALNGSYHITVRNCVVHDFSGAGISNNGGAHILLEDNLIYNNVWWSTAGSHGFANSKPETDDNADTESFKITMRGNLLFANQSLMISHVFSKGVVKLEIDEGNGLHMQNNARLFTGRFLAENNLAFLNGKAGLGLNTVDGSVIRNNSFWNNARSVASSAELSIQSSNSDDISNNLFHAAPDRGTIKDFQKNFAGVQTNYVVAGNDAADLPASVMQVPAVFQNPAEFDFTPSGEVPAGFGVPAQDRERMRLLLDEYGLVPAEAQTIVTEEYVQGLREEIFRTWPEPVAGDDIPDNLKLLDPDTGHCYRYEDRAIYPNDPGGSADCS